MNLLDPLGATASFLSTVFYIRASVYAWPFGILANITNIILYFHVGIYGDSSLEIFYFVSSIYGWYHWLRGGKNKSELPITHIRSKQIVILSGVSIIAIGFLCFGLHYFTNSTVPFLDASTTTLSLVAQWLIINKFIECWYLWFGIDAVYAGLYLYKGIPVHAGLHVIYVGMAVMGYLHWRKLQIKQQTTITKPDITHRQRCDHTLNIR